MNVGLMPYKYRADTGFIHDTPNKYKEKLFIGSYLLLSQQQEPSSFFVVVIQHLTSSSELSPNCLKVKLFCSLPHFVSFYNQHGILSPSLDLHGVTESLYQVYIEKREMGKTLELL